MSRFIGDISIFRGYFLAIGMPKSRFFYYAQIFLSVILRTILFVSLHRIELVKTDPVYSEKVLQSLCKQYLKKLSANSETCIKRFFNGSSRFCCYRFLFVFRPIKPVKTEPVYSGILFLKFYSLWINNTIQLFLLIWNFICNFIYNKFIIINTDFNFTGFVL